MSRWHKTKGTEKGILYYCREPTRNDYHYNHLNNKHKCTQLSEAFTDRFKGRHRCKHNNPRRPQHIINPNRQIKKIETQRNNRTHTDNRTNGLSRNLQNIWGKYPTLYDQAQRPEPQSPLTSDKWVLGLPRPESFLPLWQEHCEGISQQLRLVPGSACCHHLGRRSQGKFNLGVWVEGAHSIIRQYLSQVGLNAWGPSLSHHHQAVVKFRACLGPRNYSVQSTLWRDLSGALLVPGSTHPQPPWICRPECQLVPGSTHWPPNGAELRGLVVELLPRDIQGQGQLSVDEKWILRETQLQSHCTCR